MEKKYYLLAVEGPHDQAAVAKILEVSGFKKFNGKYEELDRFWDNMVPTYPKVGTLSRKHNSTLPNERSGLLYARMDMPLILTTETHSVAIYAGEGNNLVTNIVATTYLYPQYAEEIQAFGLIVDADDKEPRQVAEEKVKGSKKVSGLKSVFPTISSEPGTITAGPPRTGIYVLPNNKESGVLDSILTDCASVVYPNHKKAAENFLNSLDKALTEHFRPFSKEKALIASIVSILKPGMSNTSSIAQDKWISKQTIGAINDIGLLYEFLKDLLSLA
jgi:hypothetical protein